MGNPELPDENATIVLDSSGETPLPPGYQRLVVELGAGRRIVCHVPPGFDAVDAVTVERWLYSVARNGLVS